MDTEQYHHINRRLHMAWGKCQSQLDMSGFGKVIDEMSVLLTPEELASYMAHSTADEVEPARRWPWMKWFNGTRDLMTMVSRDGTEDLSSFDVEFQFFRGQLGVEHELPWRVEAMAVIAGYAPLHTDPDSRIVHASYKMDSVEEYEKELVRLGELGCVEVAHYRNSYGRFSYWEDSGLPWGGVEGKVILLKPRVNLRDGEAREELAEGTATVE